MITKIMKFKCECNGYVLVLEEVEKNCYKTFCYEIPYFCEELWKADLNTIIGSFVLKVSGIKRNEEKTIRIVTRD